MMNHKKPTLFVIEDQPIYSLAIDTRLKNVFNYNVRIFQTGEECLKHLDEQPDLIVMDYYLPGMNGLETMRAIKKQQPHLPIIFLSGQQEINAVLDAIQEGADGYIVKGKDAFTRLEDAILETLSKVSLKEEMIVFNITLKKYETMIPLLLIAMLGVFISVISIIWA